MCKLTKEIVSALLIAIDEILLEWNPIELDKDDLLRDEYTQYTSSVFSLLCNDAPEEEIAIHLDYIRTEKMGLPQNLIADRCVANKLVTKFYEIRDIA